MSLFLLPFPVIDPVLVNLGPLPIRWYALGYIVSLVAGWLIAQRLVRNDRLWGGLPRPKAESLDDLLVYIAFGAVLGGRIGYVLFYNLAWFLENPWKFRSLWKGGMAFHGGLAGASLGAWLFARKNRRAFAQRRRSVLRRGAHRAVSGAPRQFHQAGAVGPSDRRSLGHDFSRRRAGAAPSEPALRGGTGRVGARPDSGRRRCGAAPSAAPA